MIESHRPGFVLLLRQSLMGLTLTCLTAATLVVLPKACGGPRGPQGWHSPVVLDRGDELALAWVSTQRGKDEILVARADGQSARLKQEPFLAARRAQTPSAPILVEHGDHELLVWADHAPGMAGLYAQVLGRRGPVGRSHRLFEGAATPCRGVWNSAGAMTLAWSDAEGIYLGRVRLNELSRDGEKARTLVVPIDLTQAADAQTPGAACALARHRSGFTLVVSRGGQPSVWVALDSRGNKISERRGDPDVIALAAAPDGPTTLLLTGSSAGSTELKRLGSKLDVQSKSTWQRKAMRTVGASLEFSSAPVAVWAEAKEGNKSLSRGTVFYAAIQEGEGGGPVDPVRLSPRGVARAHVSSSGHGQRVVLAFSDTRDRGTINWGILATRTEASGERGAGDDVAGGRAQKMRWVSSSLAAAVGGPEAASCGGPAAR